MENFQRIRELTKKRILDRRRERRNRLLWHAAICSAVVVIILSIAVVVLTMQADQPSTHRIVIHATECDECHYTISQDGTSIQNLQVEGDVISISYASDRADGKLTGESYEALVAKTAQLIKEYDPKIRDVVRHCDEEKANQCPRYFAEYESAWEDFKLDVEKYIEQ